ncbi:beta-1,4-galactosyltransferase 4-like isoform X2 [Paramacrobiotus metropolitanus]|uniref:beta-1,4-galactosyltransferase 4-like isoform X2 n=1 Tax=Paramacrobiotus metropolitanus TaxID=2943436 RepID=UPI0024463368|nr:beta-1,4-galactosyltransferase 4-like isoform X2 [Paramacrobiotus metropolitanus]
MSSARSFLTSHLNSWAPARLRRILPLIFCCTLSLTTLFSVLPFIASLDRHYPRHCPSPALFPLEDNEEYVCNASGYYDAYHHRPVRWRIFYDQQDPLNGSDITPLCDKTPATLIGRQRVPMAVRTDAEILTDNPHVQRGGHWRPTHCVQRGRRRLAVIVAYRNRAEHLLLLNTLHPFLQRQQLDYTLFVVEQAGNGVFNKGKVFNAGFLETNKLRNYTCFVFNDVDLLPENDRNSYNCPEYPTLLARAIQKVNYQPMYAHHFGGVVSFASHHFREINGFSNLYWGWGAEDDDLLARVNARIGAWNKAPVDIGQYTMIKHGNDVGNPQNPERHKLLGTAAERLDTDGCPVLRMPPSPLNGDRCTRGFWWMLVSRGESWHLCGAVTTVMHCSEVDL